MSRPLITDGGMETTLIYHEGLELPHFAAFHLLRDDAGTAALHRYYARYVELALEAGVGIVLDTPTWRANPDWGSLLGYSLEELDEANRRGADLVAGFCGLGDVVVCGCVGPRGDGYRPETRMSAGEAEAYHARQVGVLAGRGVDVVSGMTLTYPEEAIGIVRAAQAARLHSVVSFTVETDGRLPDGETLAEAIGAVDAATGAAPDYYMVNCAHPTHVVHALEPDAAWVARLGGLRANASAKSHAELDEAGELDEGDPDELAAAYAALRGRLPSVTVVGGCCGTDERHVAAICRAWHGS